MFFFFPHKDKRQWKDKALPRRQVPAREKGWSTSYVFGFLSAAFRQQTCSQPLTRCVAATYLGVQLLHVWPEILYVGSKRMDVKERWDDAWRKNTNIKKIISGYARALVKQCCLASTPLPLRDCHCSQLAFLQQDLLLDSPSNGATRTTHSLLECRKSAKLDSVITGRRTEVLLNKGSWKYFNY